MPPAKRRRGNGPAEQPDLKELIETNISNATQEIKTVVNNQEKKILEKVENSSKTVLERIEKMESRMDEHISSKKSLDKKFVLNETFCDVLTMMKEGDYRYGKLEEHFGQTWRIVVKRSGNYLGVYLGINKQGNVEEWSAETFQSLELYVGNKFREAISQEGKFDDKNLYGTYFTWQEIQDRFLVDGKLSVKAQVHIKKFAGSIKPKLIDFGASAKFSDYVLDVGGQKFHVLKQLLAMRSSYFEAFFYGNFSESTKSKTALQDVDPTDFQNFLEVLHGEYKAIDDFTLEGIMLLNDVYDAKTVGERCQEFLMEKSQLSLLKKLKLVSKYKNDELKEKLISEIKTLEEYKSIVADGVDDFSHDVTKALLKKSLTLQ